MTDRQILVRVWWIVSIGLILQLAVGLAIMLVVIDQA